MESDKQKSVEMKSLNGNFVAFRCLLFFFFGGVGCLFPYLPQHMKDVGLTVYEAHIVSIVAPLVAALGPLLASPLADRLGGSRGHSMRNMLTVTMLLSAVCYALLMCVPTVQRLEARQPAVSFRCGLLGAAVLQERCMEPACYEWPEANIGPLMLNNCRYDCQTEHKALVLPEEDTGEYDQRETTTIIVTTEPSTDQNEDEDQENIQDPDDYSGSGPVEVEETLYPEEVNEDNKRKKRHVMSLLDGPPPHLCLKDDTDQMVCHVYTKSSESIAINASLMQATNTDADSEEWCKYPLAGEFSCRIPPELLAPMGHSSCQVVCSLPDPYSAVDSVLAQSQCQRIKGDATVTFWSYLLVRSVADIFPTTAVGLLDAAVVIATRETNLGRGDVGRELAFGSIGVAVFAPIVGALTNFVTISGSPPYIFAFVAFAILMVVSTLILLFAHSMPLSRPEWWSRHARVMPLGGIKRHLGEIVALIFILILLGGFWSALDSYLPWHLNELEKSDLLIGLTFTFGALPAILFLWDSEKIVNYCGHSNLLITAFTFYIIRYTVYSYLEYAWWALACEAVEVFTLHLMWVTSILYMRQLVPRHLTATAQGMAVLFHFCLGRCLGAVVAAVISTNANVVTGSLLYVYRVGAVAAAVIASIYFIVYHCCLKPCCPVSTNTSPGNQSGVLQGPTTNGTYTPLRVYHNGSGQKGQFKH